MKEYIFYTGNVRQLYFRGNVVSLYWNEKGTENSPTETDNCKIKRTGIIQNVKFDENRNTFVLVVNYYESGFCLCEQEDVIHIDNHPKRNFYSQRKHILELMYLCWFNGFYTTKTFSDRYMITESQANRIINLGRTINHKLER